MCTLQGVHTKGGAGHIIFDVVIVIVVIINRAAKPASLGHTVIFTEILANFYERISPLKFQTNPARP